MTETTQFRKELHGLVLVCFQVVKVKDLTCLYSDVITLNSGHIK